MHPNDLFVTLDTENKAGKMFYGDSRAEEDDQGKWYGWRAYLFTHVTQAIGEK